MTSELDSLSQQLQAAAESIRRSPASANATDRELSKLAECAEGLLRAIKPADPLDALVVLVQLTAVRLFIDWQVFEVIPTNGSIQYSEIAAIACADVSLIACLAGTLVAAGVLNQVGSDRVSHTRTSAALAAEGALTAVIRMECVNSKYHVASIIILICGSRFDEHLKILYSMPRYFDEYGRKEPSGERHTIAAFADGNPNLTVLEIMKREPQRMATFMASMSAMGSRQPMIGSYDFRWVVYNMGIDPDRPLVVDVGGGRGHALHAIVQATPGLPMSRCVVEDLMEVVDEARKTATGGLEEARYIPVNFHTEQPIKGAFIYYIRRCLHDYGDDDAVGILEQICQAMASDSRVLVVEQVLTYPPPPLACALDIIMASIGGKERTLEGFEEIFSRAGLQIAQVYPCPDSDFAVMECQKA
ncbi:hypothetical protein EYZ11_010742 [Aspergillus tanneri]|nr:hypothetical protein EYZ11_010742 [Aspergillus tanneri]